MMKEMNHRFGFYLISGLMIVMLVFIYIDVRGLSNDVDALLQSSQNQADFNDVLWQQQANMPPVNNVAEADAVMDDEESDTDDDTEAAEDTGINISL